MTKSTHASLEVLDAVRDPRVLAPSSFAPEVPSAFDEIVLRALAPDPDDRYATGAELEQAIARAAPVASGVAPELARTVGEMLGERIEARRRQVFSTPLADHAASRISAETGAHEIRTTATPQSATSSPRRARDAERRQLTLMSCDLDSTALAETLDPEDLHTMLRDYHRVCAEAAQRFGGELVQVGDGLLVCFGYPVAYEDAAPRAARAGLAMLGEVAVLRGRVPTGSRTTIALRVGIHTGLAVAGDLPGGSVKVGELLSVVGEARSVAVGLIAAAEPNSVVLSGPTRRIVQGFFDCEAAGRCTVKGVAKPVDVHRVVRERDARSRIDVSDAGVGALTPLVGRDREVGLLLDRWEQVKEQQGQVAMLVGEPGIGKSRLTFVVKQRVQSEHDAGDPRTIMEWRGSPLHQNSSFNPVSEFVERAVGLRRDQPADTELARLEEWLTLAGLPLAESVPLFAALIAFPLPAKYPPLSLTPERLRQKTLEALSEWVRRRTEAAPVLLIVEDLHWIDASTLELLRVLIAECSGERLFLVLTFRPEFKPPWSDPRFTQVPLQRLNKRQIGEMLEQRTSAKPLPPEVREQIAARSDGVPLFIEECTNMLLETGLLREEAGRYVLTGELPRDAIPATLQDLLMTRLDRLGDAKEIAQLGSALGREFPHELLQAASTLDASTLDEQLGRVLEAEVMHKKGRPPQQTYCFKHALIQDAAYSTLLKSKRQQHHQRIAEVLETRSRRP